MAYTMYVPITLNRNYMPFGNVLPYEIQELIIEYRYNIIMKERQEFINCLTISELIRGLDIKIEQNVPHEQIGDRGYNVKGSSRLYNITGYNVDDIIESIDLGINIHRNSINGNPPLVEYWDNLEEQEQYIIAGECFDSFDITSDILRGNHDDFQRLSMYCIHWITTNKGFVSNP